MVQKRGKKSEPKANKWNFEKFMKRIMPNTL
jgi:glutathione peroxidase-family protein